MLVPARSSVRNEPQTLMKLTSSLTSEPPPNEQRANESRRNSKRPPATFESIVSPVLRPYNRDHDDFDLEFRSYRR